MRRLVRVSAVVLVFAALLTTACVLALPSAKASDLGVSGGDGVDALGVPFLSDPLSALPVVTGLVPSQAEVGELGLTVTVVGSGFVHGSVVLWNGENRDTGYISENMLTATVRGSDLATPGTAFVSVSNPGPGGGQSLVAGVFSVLNPLPRAESLEPALVWAGTAELTVTVVGSGFTTSSVIQVAGADMPTTFESGERLHTTVSGAVLNQPMDVSVRVFTPPPGGGLSQAVPLHVEEDRVPPVTVVEGLDGLWHRKPVTLTFVATDVGRGVERTFYRLDSRGEFIPGNTLRIPAPMNHSNDGTHLVQFFSIDRVLNWEEPPKWVQVAIDTRPPTTSVAAATVVRGGGLRPRFMVYDSFSPLARDATLQIVDGEGEVVQRWSLGKPKTRTWLTGSPVAVSVKRGAYKMRVLAHDLAGNAQSSTKSAVLTVK